MAGFSGGATADMAENNYEWSGEDEDWADDLALSTMKVIWDEEKTLNNNDSSSDSDSDVSDDEAGRPAPQGKPANKKSTEQTTSEGEIRRWISYPENFPKTPKLPEFDPTGCGVTENVDLTTTKTPLDFFRLFFNMAFVTSLVGATNTYAEETRNAEPGKQKIKWTPVTPNCIAKFLGLTLLMGLIRKPTIKDYWSTATELSTPFFRSIMSRDRFIAILR